MNRTISFRYSIDATKEMHVDFFERLMSQNHLSKTKEVIHSKQLICFEDLLACAEQLQHCCDPGTKLTVDQLEQTCISTLTRTVEFKELTFKDQEHKSTVEIRFCDDNSFPVLGLDLWRVGVESLPAGLLSVCSNSSDLIDVIAFRMLNFVNPK